MIALLTALFKVISEWLKGRNQEKLIEVGRQEATAAVKDAVDEQVKESEDVGAVADPVFDQRMRSRFDAAARGE